MRLFPCDCHGGESIDATNHVPGSDCAIRLDTGGTSTHVSSRCWASRNLHCPYLRPLNFNTLPATDQERLNTFRMQAQLTYLYEDDANQPPDPYLNPNGIDGSWGVGAQDAIRRFRWKHRLAIYTTANMPANEAGTSGDAPTEGDATWNELNNQALTRAPI
ncbi:MAG: hypothetical protein IPM36_24290 [Lewinellaceae bacterium]|nr:hypothetical protein [Lewinellaceae bacterium]